MHVSCHDRPREIKELTALLVGTPNCSIPQLLKACEAAGKTTYTTHRLTILWRDILAPLAAPLLTGHTTGRRTAAMNERLKRGLPGIVANALKRQRGRGSGSGRVASRTAAPTGSGSGSAAHPSAAHPVALQVPVAPQRGHRDASGDDSDSDSDVVLVSET